MKVFSVFLMGLMVTGIVLITLFTIAEEAEILLLPFKNKGNYHFQIS